MTSLSMRRHLEDLTLEAYALSNERAFEMLLEEWMIGDPTFVWRNVMRAETVRQRMTECLDHPDTEIRSLLEGTEPPDRQIESALLTVRTQYAEQFEHFIGNPPSDEEEQTIVQELSYLRALTVEMMRRLQILPSIFPSPRLQQ